MCAQRDLCRGQSGLTQIMHESMLHVVGQAQYVDGVLQGVVEVEHLQGWTGINPGCSKMKQLGQGSAGEARKDGIIGQGHNKRKKCPRKRGPHLDWQSVIVSGR